ncbi:MAG: InlB B-repeat-containing protein [Clostridiales bacterium]|nr:InlB B-repeat-containing protein [Clostridiales bacterium]
MSKKGLKTMLVCIVLLIGLVTLFACNKSNVADKDGQTKVIVKIQDEDGSIYKENVVFSDLFTLSLQKEGYTGRLYRDADFLKPLTKDSKVKNGDTVYVKWTINKYTVTFMDGEKVLATFTNVTHGDTVTAPEVPEKDGKTFKGWDKPFDNVTSDLTINAVYDVDTFTVTFKDGEKVLETQTVEYEAAATAPDTARLSPPEGMQFAKWDKDFSKVTEDIEVSAVYEPNEYSVIFKNGETTLKTEMVKHGFAATPPNVFDTATKKFVGWDKSFDNVTSDLIVNAKFETKKFTLTFINFDGTTVYTAEVEYGASIDSHFETADSAATYDDILDYDGWYKADGTRIDELDLPTMPAENFTLTLKLRLMDSAIGDFKVNTPADFTFTESNTAEFSVMPNEGTTLHAGVTYKYIWTINKDNVFYKTEETTESSLTLQNLAAGEYLANVKIVASIENCGSVEKDFSAGETLIVSRADISDITVTGVTMTYGDKTAKIGISGLRADDVVTYGTDGTTFPLQNVDLSALDCGEYDYFVRVYRGDNYNPYTSGKITVTINKAEVSATVTPDDDTLTYGDNLPSLTATINGETYTIESGKYELHLGMTSITGDVANNVGTYNIENVDISVLREKYPEKNYDIKLTTVGAITINQAKLTVTVSLDKTELTYGEDSPIISYTFSGLKSSDKEDDFTITKTKFAEKLDAGTYTAAVTVSGDKTKFYEINVNTADFTVKQKAATITINEIKDIVYGDKVPDLSAKVDGVLDGDSLSYALETDYTVGKKPGNYYNVKVVFDKNAEANKNYAITTTVTTFYVGTKDLTIKLNNTPTVAVGKTYKVEAEHLEKIGLVAGDTVTGYVTITKDVAGTYNADAFDKTNLVVMNADCYDISYEMSVEFIEVTFAIDFADVTLTYDGQPHGVSVTKTDDSKNYTITYGTTENDCTLNSSPAYKNAGTYTIYFKVVDNDTYAEHVGYVTLTINKKAVEIKVNDVTITYGDTPVFSYEVTGLVEGETLSDEAVYSGAGTDAGDYEISVSGLTASNNYNASFVPGKLTIDKKPATVTWNIAESYVYSPAGQTLPTATYDGKTASLIFTKDDKACEFKNAGTYTVTIADDNNYDLTGSETTKTIVINKAKYTAAPELSLTGTYDPNKTLGNYALSEDFTWVNPGETPVCTKTEYAAKYNTDSANYEDFETKVTLVLQKATVTLAQNLFEFNFDGASHEISTTVKYNNIEVTEPYTLTFEKNMFSAAGTHKTTATLTADNFALSDNVVYVKVKGVKVGNNYYTIEDALDVAKEGQTIFVLNDTAFATQEIAGVLYNDVKFKTVKTGVTLLLPFNENDTVGHIGAGEDGSANYNATAALTGTAQLYKTLVIPEGIEVIVNGKLIVGAQTGKIDAGTNQNAVSGNYCEISLGGTITLNNATLEVYGYIKGNGEIIANNSTVIENLYLSGWMGGKISAIRYIGNDKILAGTLMIEGELKIDKPTQFPFSQYELRSIEAKLVVNKGSKLQGYAKIATGAIATVRAQINEAWLTFVSSDANNVDSGLFRLVGNNSKIIKSMNGDRIKIDLFGEIKDGYTSISILVINRTVSMTSEKVFFPIDGRTDITLKNGATFTQSYMFKALPGATITVENGGTYNLNGQLIMYDKSFTDISTYPYPGASRGDAKLTVNGTMNVNGALGGNVTSDNAGTVAVEANATISGIHSAEGEGTMEVGLSVKFTFNDTCGVTKSLEFVNADNTTVAAATDRTYNYNNGTWQ